MYCLVRSDHYTHKIIPNIIYRNHNKYINPLYIAICNFINWRNSIQTFNHYIYKIQKHRYN